MDNNIVKYVCGTIAAVAILGSFGFSVHMWGFYNQYIVSSQQQGVIQGENRVISDVINTVKQSGEAVIPYKDKDGNELSITLIEKALDPVPVKK